MKTYILRARQALANLGVAKADTLVSLVNWLAIPSLIVYLFCMVLVPWSKGNWDWANLQNVWDRWQTLNAAILAFIASVIALNIAKYHENKQRERKFTAARAFLPHALDELLGYYQASGKLLINAWEFLGPAHELEPEKFVTELPDPPVGYAETFSRCIEHAESDVGDYMAAILVKLQVHHSRMNQMHDSLINKSHVLMMRSNAVSYIFSLAELYALTAKLFPFARAMDLFDNSDLVWNDYCNAYGLLNVWLEEVDGLKELTEQKIAKSGKTSF